MENIVSFSGGKDSTAMLLMMIEKNMKIDRILCVDTTKEYPEMYEHIKKVQSNIEYKIEIIKIDFDYLFGEHIKTKGKKKGEKGYGWPGHISRWCTRAKISAMAKAKPKYYIEYIGIAYNEKERADKKYFQQNNIITPLIDWKITGKQALEYCYSKGFDWGGLYEKTDRLSCWCCPLSSVKSLRMLYNNFPDLWLDLIAMDQKSIRPFKSKYSVNYFNEKFLNENLLNKTLSDYRKKYR